MKNTPSLDFYKQIQMLMLDIDTYERMLRTQKEERELLIKKSGPAPVRSIKFGEVHTTAYISEQEVIIRIAQLSVLIKMNEAIVTKKKALLKKLRDKGVAVAERLDDRVLKVFVDGYIDKKSNEEIARTHQWEIGTVWNAKVVINRILEKNAVM
jgi:hypothetical protein